MDMQISFSDEGDSMFVNFYFCEFPPASDMNVSASTSFLFWFHLVVKPVLFT